MTKTPHDYTVTEADLSSASLRCDSFTLANSLLCRQHLFTGLIDVEQKHFVIKSLVWALTPFSQQWRLIYCRCSLSSLAELMFFFFFLTALWKGSWLLTETFPWRSICTALTPGPVLSHSSMNLRLGGQNPLITQTKAGASNSASHSQARACGLLDQKHWPYIIWLWPPCLHVRGGRIGPCQYNRE